MSGNASGECILWSGSKAGNGYGVFSLNGKNIYAHRAVASLWLGEIPSKLVVAHTCDVPACVNPAHLFVCTQADNMRDMKEKGRSATGEKHRTRTRPDLVLKGEGVGTSKLDADSVLRIRREYKIGSAGVKSETSLAGLSRKYGVAFQTVQKIVKGKTWKHL